MPVGYFLTDGLSGSEKAERVKRCLTFVHDAGVLVPSITFDGVPSNFTMAKTLGANFQDPDNLIASFPHPITKDEVFIFLDPCHMLKLIRNCLGSHKVLKAGNGEIDWEHFDNLFKEQNLQGLHAATEIRIRHLQWTREKMKVRLAAQTLSKSVSDSLLFLSKDLKHPTFRKAGPTAEFALKFNNLFDIFNSRSRFVKYPFKKPMSKSTEPGFLGFFYMMKAYIKHLMLQDTPILKSQRKVGFIGFLICIEEMFRIYVKEKKLLKLILTYKLSQNHLELFFGAIRCRGGFNNNPTARQFEAAYKRLLVHSEITPGVIALELEKLLIPSHSVRNTSVTMECHYKLGGETLYSVKWYKDGNEFYRYVPRNQPPAQVFPLPGVTVDLHNSTEYSVVLSSVQLSTSGLYRCEVSGEAPYFETVTDHAYMMVVALPKIGPEISGGQKRYHVGDIVNVTCTTKESKPAAQLNWMINGEPADSKYIRGPYKQFVGREGLESTSLVLEFVARPKHFKRGNMKLKCLATIATVYTTNNEKSYEGERPQKGLVLESRGTVAPPGSRADRVHTSGSLPTASTAMPSITKIMIIAWLYLNRLI